VTASQHNRPVGAPSNGVPEDVFDAPVEALKKSRSWNRKIATGHYENFFVTSCLLPKTFRQAFFDVYAFCRVADDLADESRSVQDALKELDLMEHDLQLAFHSPRHALESKRVLFVALSETIHRFQLSREPFLHLLKAFRLDQAKTEYKTEQELLQYCQLSANPVGRILLELSGSRTEEAKLLSDCICTGLQLVNFLQDVREDLERGRIYLPEEERKAFGVDFGNLCVVANQRALRFLIQSRCETAKSLFHRGEELKNHVPPWFSSSVSLFVHGGLEAVRAIEKKDYDVLAGRPKVSRARQLWLLFLASIRCLR
jgi:squalene synthase HpnC